MIKQRETLNTKLHIRVNDKELDEWRALSEEINVELSTLVREGVRLIVRRERRNKPSAAATVSDEPTTNSTFPAPPQGG